MSIFDPLVLQGISQGLLAGRQGQQALQQADADRAVRQQIASTDLLRAKNEALAPFRGEITRQLQVHDAYRPYHQAALIEQYHAKDASDPRVQTDMATWDATMDPYRQALGTDDPTEVARIIRQGMQQTGQLPPVHPPAADAAPAAAGASYQFGVPYGLPGAIQRSFNPTPDPAALLRNGAEVPAVVQTAGDGLPPLGSPGNPRHGTGPAYAGPPAGTPGNPRHSAAPPTWDQHAYEAYQMVFGTPDRPGDITAPAPAPKPAAATPAADDDATVSTGPSIAVGNLTPPASTLHLTPRFSDPALATAMQNATDQYQQRLQHPLGLLHAPAPPPPAPAGPVSRPAPNVPPVPYDPAHPNPSPGPVAGSGPAGSQNPSHAQGTPFLAQGPDGTPVIRVPGVGDVPAVTAQRVLDQALADPAVQASRQFMTHMNLVAAQGPGVDPAVLDKANTTYQTAWSNALQRYGELDKLPGDQLNTLMTAYSNQQTAEATRLKAPAEKELALATAAKTREETRLLAPKTEAEIQEILTRNIEMLHKAGLDDAQRQREMAGAARDDAERQNIPITNRIKFIDADLKGRAALLDAKAKWETAQGDDTEKALKNLDPILAHAVAGVQGSDGRINTLSAWMVIKRAEMHPDDANAQTAKQGALQLLQAATASYYGGHPELVNGPVPQTDAWIGRDLWEQKHSVADYLNKNDDKSKRSLEAVRSWRAFERMMSGGSPGTYPQSLGTPGYFTRWIQGLQTGWTKWQQEHPGPFSGWGQADKVRSFIPPAPPPTAAGGKP